MTLTLARDIDTELDPDILKMYTHTPKIKFLCHGLQKLEHEQYRQTDRHRHTDATEHMTTAAFVGGNGTDGLSYL